MLTVEAVTSLMEAFRQKKRLPRKYIVSLLEDAKRVFGAEPNVYYTTVAPSEQMTIVGDIHGQVGLSPPCDYIHS